MKSAEEYSVLYPLTSSLSPSLKSKGVRWVSARIVAYQINLRERERINILFALVLRLSEKVRVWRITKRAKKVVTRLTSYEIDWATPRIVPIREYLELDDQPDSSRKKKPKEVMHKIMG